jgi:pilus assembly protein CpaB
VQRIFQSRGGTVIIGGLAALAAAALLLVYLAKYRDSLNNSNQSVTVLVATRLIPEGTPGSQVASQHWYKQDEVQRRDLQDGAITDPSQISGKIAGSDVFPGTQLTTTEFASAPSNSAAIKLTGTERAVAVPLDAAHGALGYIHPGDHVDILAGFNVVPLDKNGIPKQGAQQRPVMKVIAQDVQVLFVPSAASSTDPAPTNGPVVVKLPDATTASEVAFAADNGKLWLTVRAPDGSNGFTSPLDKANFMTLEQELFGVKPVAVERSFGGK